MKSKLTLVIFLIFGILCSFIFAGKEVNAANRSSDCPQKRSTKNVSENFLNQTNPLQSTAEDLKAGESLYQKLAKPMACKLCHGDKGDGRGPGAAGISPAPRNFTCSETMNEISDGQMFGVIKNGSTGTAMPAFQSLKDNEIWQLVLYIREFSK